MEFRFNYMILKIKKILSMKNVSLMLLLAIFLIMAIPEQSNAANDLKKTKQKINYLKKLEKKEMNKLNRNQIKLENAERDLNYSKAKYSSTETQLRQLEADYNKAMSEFDSVNYSTGLRIRQIYERHTDGLIELLLSSENINDLLDNIHYQNIITKSDKALFENSRAKARSIRNLKLAMETQREYLQRSITKINYQQQSIQRAINENERYINRLKNDRATYERAEKELAKQSSSLGNMISHSKSSTVATTGAFMKPIGGPITSSFGHRIHPIFKSRIFHSGIDIGGPSNGAVKAANNGKVIYAGWYGGYGKVVILDHGNYNGSPTTTLYAHLNSYSVSVGQYLVKGQVLGREGSTGYSTGPHVHFEVRVNGQPRNPLNYI